MSKKVSYSLPSSTDFTKQQDGLRERTKDLVKMKNKEPADKVALDDAVKRAGIKVPEKVKKGSDGGKKKAKGKTGSGKGHRPVKELTSSSEGEERSDDECKRGKDNKREKQERRKREEEEDRSDSEDDDSDNGSMIRHRRGGKKKETESGKGKEEVRQSGKGKKETASKAGKKDKGRKKVVITSSESETESEGVMFTESDESGGGGKDCGFATTKHESADVGFGWGVEDEERRPAKRRDDDSGTGYSTVNRKGGASSKKDRKGPRPDDGENKEGGKKQKEEEIRGAKESDDSIGDGGATVDQALHELAGHYRKEKKRYLDGEISREAWDEFRRHISYEGPQFEIEEDVFLSLVTSIAVADEKEQDSRKGGASNYESEDAGGQASCWGREERRERRRGADRESTDDDWGRKEGSDVDESEGGENEGSERESGKGEYPALDIIKARDDQITKLTSIISMSDARITSLQEACDTVRDRLGEQEADNVSLLAKVGALKDVVKQRDEELTKLAEQRTALQEIVDKPLLGEDEPGGEYGIASFMSRMLGGDKLDHANTPGLAVAVIMYRALQYQSGAAAFKKGDPKEIPRALKQVPLTVLIPGLPSVKNFGVVCETVERWLTGAGVKEMISSGITPATVPKPPSPAPRKVPEDKPADPKDTPVPADRTSKSDKTGMKELCGNIEMVLSHQESSSSQQTQDSKKMLKLIRELQARTDEIYDMVTLTVDVTGGDTVRRITRSAMKTLRSEVSDMGGSLTGISKMMTDADMSGMHDAFDGHRVAIEKKVDILEKNQEAILRKADDGNAQRKALNSNVLGLMEVEAKVLTKISSGEGPYFKTATGAKQADGFIGLSSETAGSMAGTSGWHGVTDLFTAETPDPAKFASFTPGAAGGTCAIADALIRKGMSADEAHICLVRFIDNPEGANEYLAQWEPERKESEGLDDIAEGLGDSEGEAASIKSDVNSEKSSSSKSGRTPRKACEKVMSDGEQNLKSPEDQDDSA